MPVDRTAIMEDMEVVGADGRHLGWVDGVEGDRLKLKKSDAADRQHHYVKLVDLHAVRDAKVWLDVHAAVS